MRIFASLVTAVVWYVFWSRRGISRRSLLVSYGAVVAVVYSLWPYAQSVGRGEPFWVNLRHFGVSFVVFQCGFWITHGASTLWGHLKRRREQRAADEDVTDEDLNEHI